MVEIPSGILVTAAVTSWVLACILLAIGLPYFAQGFVGSGSTCALLWIFWGHDHD